VPIDWDGVTVNDDYKSAEHTDKGNEGQSYTVSFGDFTGGELCVRGQGGSLAWESEEKKKVETRRPRVGCPTSHNK